MINPARDSRWYTIKDGKTYQITIEGIWARGVKEHYQVVAYDLKYDHLAEIQTIPVEKMNQLLQDKILNPLTT